METKPFYQSKTLFGAVVLLVVFIAQIFGKKLDANDADLNALVESFFHVIGLILVVWGRLTAQTKLSGPPPKPHSSFYSSA